MTKEEKDAKFKENQAKYDAEFDRIEAIRKETETLREQRTYDIAVGGLTVSIGIFTYLATHVEKVPAKWMIIAIMACFALAVILNFYSHIVTAKRMTEILQEINNLKGKNEPYKSEDIQDFENKKCKYANPINWTVTALMMAGIVLIVIYGIKYILL